jgi:hypothetical protein
MVPENKQNRRYKQIIFIGLQNIRHPSQHAVGNVHKASGNCLLESIAEPQAPDQGSTVGELLFVSPPEEHHERRTFCRRGGNP